MSSFALFQKNSLPESCTPLFTPRRQIFSNPTIRQSNKTYFVSRSWCANLRPDWKDQCRWRRRTARSDTPLLDRVSSPNPARWTPTSTSRTQSSGSDLRRSRCDICWLCPPGTGTSLLSTPLDTGSPPLRTEKHVKLMYLYIVTLWLTATTVTRYKFILSWLVLYHWHKKICNSAFSIMRQLSSSSYAIRSAALWLSIWSSWCGFQRSIVVLL